MFQNMAKNSMKQIKKDEKKILQELKKNSNKSINEIAKTCGFSRQKVWRIIKNLEKNDTIWGYTAIVDDEKLDKKGYITLIKRSNTPLTKEFIDTIVKREVATEAKEINVDVVSSIYTNGIYDWIICFTAENIRDAKRFCENLNKKFEGFIDELHLLEKMFPAQLCGINNPNMKELEGFFDTS